MVLIFAQTHVQVFRKRKTVALDVLDKAKAVVLEHDVAKFAATALGQVINAVSGVKLVSLASHCLCLCMLAIDVQGSAYASMRLGPDVCLN